jgi:hypothetical protein
LPTSVSLPGRHHEHDATRRALAHRLEPYSPKLIGQGPRGSILLIPSTLSYRPRLSGEVVDNLHLAFEDDYEVVGGVARPEEDVPDLRLARLPIALKDLDLVFPQRRGPRTTNLSGSIDHGVPLSIALSVASIVPLSAARRIPTIAYCYLSVAIGLRTQANFLELRQGKVLRTRVPRR